MSEDTLPNDKDPFMVYSEFAETYPNDPELKHKQNMVDSLASIYRLTRNPQIPNSEIENKYTEWFGQTEPGENEKRTAKHFTEEQMDYLESVINAIEKRLKL